MSGRVGTSTSLLTRLARVAGSRQPWQPFLALGSGDPDPLALATAAGPPLPLPATRSSCLGNSHSYVWWPLQLQLATFASKGGAKHGRGGGQGRGAGGGGGGKGDRGSDKGAAEEAELPQFDMAPFVSQMRAALEHLQRELVGIRTGRASPGLLEAVVVADCSHGNHVPLRGLGTVVVRNPHLLVVEVYDPKDAQPVATAIQTSPLKLQARVEGSEVLVELPRLTMDMVERMVRLAGQEAEAARAEVRRARHRALELARKVAAAGGVSSEEAKRREAQIQAATNQHIGEVDALLKAKEKDLREKH